MSKSNKPIIWGPFAAGGTVTALLTPVLVLLTLLAALGHTPDALTYDGLRAFAAHWFGKVAIVTVIVLSLWSAAHRLRITFYDFGARSDSVVAAAVYLAAAAGSVAIVVFVAAL